MEPMELQPARVSHGILVRHKSEQPSCFFELYSDVSQRLHIKTRRKLPLRPKRSNYGMELPPSTPLPLLLPQTQQWRDCV